MIEMPRFESFFEYIQKEGLALNIEYALDVFANMLCDARDGDWRDILHNHQNNGYGKKLLRAPIQCRKPTDEHYVVYADGAYKRLTKQCSIGGASYVILRKGKIVSYGYHGYKNVSHTDMELASVVEGVFALPYNCDVELYTDSIYALSLLRGVPDLYHSQGFVYKLHKVRQWHKNINTHHVPKNQALRYHSFSDSLSRLACQKEIDMFYERS